VASETLVHTLLRAWYEVRELVLHLYKNVADDLLVHRHDGRVVRVLEHRRYICEVHDLALRLHGELLERELVLRLYKNVTDDLLVRRHDGRVVRVLEHRRCTYAVRELDGHLRNDCVQREFRLAFRHPYVVVCPKDSKHHCCAWRHELLRAEIRRDCGHLGREVREVHGIRLLPP
jgi:hypothetical protein